MLRQGYFGIGGAPPCGRTAEAFTLHRQELREENEHHGAAAFDRCFGPAGQDPRPVDKADREGAEVRASMPKSFGPLPAQIWNVLGSWTAAMHWITQLMLVWAAWIPIGLIVVGIVILVCDPGLLLKLVWSSLQALPQFIRSNLADAAVRPPAQVYLQFAPSVPQLSAVPSMSFEPPSQPVPQFFPPQLR